MRNKILLAEDETTLSTIISETLEDEGYEVIAATNGVDGLAAFRSDHPDIVIADVMMPRMDGFEMARHIRNTNPDVPLIFLTALSSISDIETGFDIGADDYLKKPFKMRELILRIRALLKRRNIPTSREDAPEKNEIPIGEYIFDAIGNKLIRGSHVIELSRIEAMILLFLINHRGITVRSSELMEFVWQHDDYYNRNSLHGYIHKLRKHLRHDPNVSIINLRGIGYRLAITT
jgi:two-component system response regulator